MEKFKFPSRGFHLVADKVGEADYFLDSMKAATGNHVEFGYLFSAFVSAARSVTFVLQSVMHEYPGFSDWYPSRQAKLRESKLARFFVQLRNHSQKVGDPPLCYGGWSQAGVLRWEAYFVNTQDFADVPAGDALELSEGYLRLILSVIAECYRDFRSYVDPTAFFSEETLLKLGWSVEDVEESLGLPRGWTDIGPWKEPEKTAKRLKALSSYGGDELMEQYFVKYDIFAERAGQNPSRSPC